MQDSDMHDSSTNTEPRKHSSSSERAAPAAAAAASGRAASASIISCASASSSSRSSAGAPSAKDLNFFADKDSKAVALAKLAAPFSQAAASLLAVVSDRTSAAQRAYDVDQLREAMEMEVQRLNEYIGAEEDKAQKHTDQLERLHKEIPMLNVRLAAFNDVKENRKTALEARRKRVDRLRWKTVGGVSVKLSSVEEDSIRHGRTEEGASEKVQAMTSEWSKEIAILNLNSSRDRDSAELLSTDPAHPDHARKRAELVAKVEQLKAENVGREDENKSYIENKHAEEEKELAEIARVKAVEEEMEKERKEMEEIIREIHELDVTHELEVDLQSEWTRQLNAANSAAPPPEPSAKMAQTDEWKEWMRLMDESRQSAHTHRAPLASDHKEIVERLALLTADLTALRVDRARVDGEYAQVFAQMQRLEQQQKPREAPKAQRTGATNSAEASVTPQSQQTGTSSMDEKEDEKMNDESGVSAAQAIHDQPQRPQPQRSVQRAPVQRKFPAGFVPAAPQPVYSGVNARPQQHAVQQHQPASAPASRHYAAQRPQPVKMPQLQPHQPQSRQQPQQPQQQQSQFGGAGISVSHSPYGHAVYPMVPPMLRASSPQGPFQAGGSPWAANQIPRPPQIQPQPQMMQMVQQPSQPQQPQQYSQHQQPYSQLQLEQRLRLDYDPQALLREQEADQQVLAQRQAYEQPPAQQRQRLQHVLMTEAQLQFFQQQQIIAQQQHQQQQQQQQHIAHQFH